MTDPHEELEKAHEQVNRALESAKQKKRVSSLLGEGWRKSREANNFRTMLRRLATPEGE